MKTTLLTLMALLLPYTAFAQLPVEPGSTGNLVTVVFVNTHDRLPLQATVAPSALPAFVLNWEAPINRLVPDLAWPGESSSTSFIFDVDPGVAPGTMGNVVFKVFRAPDDSTIIPMPLEVVAPMPLSADVEVLFTADMTTTTVPGGSTLDARVDDALVIGLADDGVAPDPIAGDDLWTGSTIFLAGTLPQHRYELELGGTAECDSFVTPEQRVFRVEEILYDAVGTPQLLPTATYGLCTLVGAPPAGPGSIASLAGNRPNPFGSATVFSWVQTQDAQVELVLFDVRGRRVSQPLDRTHYAAGEHLLGWSPEAAGGRRLATGAYFLRLIVDGQPRDTRRILLVR